MSSPVILIPHQDQSYCVSFDTVPGHTTVGGMDTHSQSIQTSGPLDASSLNGAGGGGMGEIFSSLLDIFFTSFLPFSTSDVAMVG